MFSLIKNEDVKTYPTAPVARACIPKNVCQQKFFKQQENTIASNKGCKVKTKGGDTTIVHKKIERPQFAPILKICKKNNNPTS